MLVKLVYYNETAFASLSAFFFLHLMMNLWSIVSDRFLCLFFSNNIMSHINLAWHLLGILINRSEWQLILLICNSSRDMTVSRNDRRGRWQKKQRNCNESDDRSTVWVYSVLISLPSIVISLDSLFILSSHTFPFSSSNQIITWSLREDRG